MDGAGEGRLVLTSSRILFQVSRLIGVVPAVDRVRSGCRAGAVGWRALERTPRRRSLGSARRRVLASGEGRLVLTSSRILFQVSRLIGVVPAVDRVRSGCRAGAVGWRALERTPRRRSLGSARRRVLASGEGRLVLTSSRILFQVSRLIGVVPAVDRVRSGCRAGAVGWRALVDEFKADRTSRHAREGGRPVSARCRSAGWTCPPKTLRRPLSPPPPPPPHTKVWPSTVRPVTEPTRSHG